MIPSVWWATPVCRELSPEGWWAEGWRGPQHGSCPHQWVLSHSVWLWLAGLEAVTAPINRPWHGKWQNRARNHPGVSVRSKRRWNWPNAWLQSLSRHRDRTRDKLPCTSRGQITYGTGLVLSGDRAGSQHCYGTTGAGTDHPRLNWNGVLGCVQGRGSPKRGWLGTVRLWVPLAPWQVRRLLTLLPTTLLVTLLYLLAGFFRK